MIRRQIAGSLLAWACVPLAGWAQPVPRRARIAVLGGSAGMTDPATMRGMIEPLRKGPRDLGWIEGRNLDIEWRFAEGQPQRVPSIRGGRGYLDGGGLASFQGDCAELFRRSASLIDKILKGTPPGEIPFEQSTKFELVLNLKAAWAQGLKLPQSVLVSADEVIQ
jgi:ABC transporter substrate binding protein